MLPARLELARNFRQRILSPLRLPFPSREHGYPNMTRTCIVRFKAVCATIAPSDNIGTCGENRTLNLNWF